MRVYVVGWAPAPPGEGGFHAAAGGFEWFTTVGQTVSYAKRTLREIGGLGLHSVTYVPLDVPDDVAYPDDQTVADRDAITAWINGNLHLVEVGLVTAGDDPTKERFAERLGDWLGEPRQTRPSAILRRPDPETPISEATTAELLYEAHERMGSRPRTFALGSPLNPSDEFERREEDLARARQATEDAISLHNRAVYRERGVFAITDAERIPETGGEGA